MFLKFKKKGDFKMILRVFAVLYSWRWLKIIIVNKTPLNYEFEKKVFSVQSRVWLFFLKTRGRVFFLILAPAGALSNPAEP